MIGCCHDHDVTRQGVDLKQQRAHDTFDLPCLVNITTLLPERIEFVEEQDALMRAYEVEETLQSAARLA